MTGDELRAMIAEIEAKHGADVDFHAGRVWAMQDRFILARILDNKMRWPEPPKMTREEKNKASLARRQKMHDMEKSGMTHKKIGEAFGISSGRVGQILMQHAYWLRRQAIKEASQ
jgi:phage terminase large subunit-like protein